MNQPEPATSVADRIRASFEGGSWRASLACGLAATLTMRLVMAALMAAT
ncbi:MAG: hypothetical protein WBR18_02685 [Anaerolineales bacterium]